MTTEHWYRRKTSRWEQFQTIPTTRLLMLLFAVFALFSTWGIFGDLMGGGRDPYLILFINIVYSGLTSVLWVLFVARFPLSYLVVPATVQLVGSFFLSWADRTVIGKLGLHSVDGAIGIRVCAAWMMVAVISSYTLFILFIRRLGKESFKLRAELELAHGIQKTLVPPIALRLPRFEVYGYSRPSEKVGGDLVDALSLPNGDAVAYLADIAGHGLQAGILMGMLKTAVRTALLDAGERAPQQTMPLLLNRLNSVLPEVKEAHMYATFTGFRLGADGTVYYALAASPPILHWHANGMSRIEEEQFPLGLLPVPPFTGQQMHVAPGDLLIVATDGILEVTDKNGDEFGEQRLGHIVEAHSAVPLPELAANFLEAAGAFGNQLDDQTILLIRCL
jgi:serine phosphatase RsbU (regulator of sigma subunit)